MKQSTVNRFWIGALCVASLVASFVAAAPAQAAFDDPISLFRPLRPPPEEPPIPPPVGDFEGPCGITVSNGEVGNFLVSDYYHHAIDRFGPGFGYADQIKDVDPDDGPCALSFDGADILYV